MSLQKDSFFRWCIMNSVIIIVVARLIKAASWILSQIHLAVNGE